MHALSTWFQLFALFTQTYISGNQAETIKGYLLWSSPDTIYIHIIEPINQRVLLADGKMLIYYPDAPKALEILLNPDNPYAHLAVAPSIQPIDEETILSTGLIEIQRSENNGQTHVQYRQKGDKNPFPIINITEEDGLVTQLNTIKAMSVYTNMDIHEIATLHDEVFLKSYTTSDYSSNKLVGETTVTFDSLQVPNQEKINSVMFTIPKWLDVETRKFY